MRSTNLRSTRRYKNVQKGTRRKTQASLFAFFILLSCTLFYFFVLAPISFAQSPAPSATPTLSVSPTPLSGVNGTLSVPTPAKEIIESAQERLKKAVQEKADEARKVLDAKNRIAMIGKIKDITSSAITIQLKSGSTGMAAITDQTVIMRNGKSAKSNELSIGDFVISMGYANGKDNFDAKRVIAQTDEPKSRDAKIIFGTVAKINPDKNTFSITANRPAELGGPEVIELSASKSSIDLTKLNLEDKTLIIAIPGKTGRPLIAKAVKIIK